MKMSGWEEQFQQRIDNIRKKEINQIKKAYRLYGINEALFFSSKCFVLFVYLYNFIIQQMTIPISHLYTPFGYYETPT